MAITLTHDLRLGPHFARFDYCDLMLTADGSSTVAVHRSSTTATTFLRNILAAVSRKLGRLMAEEDPASGWVFVNDVTQEELEQVLRFVYDGQVVFKMWAEVDRFKLTLDTLAVELEVKEQRMLEQRKDIDGKTCGGDDISKKESPGSSPTSMWRGRRVEFREVEHTQEGQQEPPGPGEFGHTRSRSRSPSRGGRRSRSEARPSFGKKRKVVEKR